MAFPNLFSEASKYESPVAPSFMISDPSLTEDVKSLVRIIGPSEFSKLTGFRHINPASTLENTNPEESKLNDLFTNYRPYMDSDLTNPQLIDDLRIHNYPLAVTRDNETQEYVKTQDLSPSDVKNILLKEYQKYMSDGIKYMQKFRTILPDYEAISIYTDKDKFDELSPEDKDILSKGKWYEQLFSEYSKFLTGIKVETMVALSLHLDSPQPDSKSTLQWQNVKEEADKIFGHKSLVSEQVKAIGISIEILNNDNDTNTKKLKEVKLITDEPSDEPSEEYQLIDEQSQILRKRLNFTHAHFIELEIFQKAIDNYKNQIKDPKEKTDTNKNSYPKYEPIHLSDLLPKLIDNIDNIDNIDPELKPAILSLGEIIGFSPYSQVTGLKNSAFFSTKPIQKRVSNFYLPQKIFIEYEHYLQSDVLDESQFMKQFLCLATVTPLELKPLKLEQKRFKKKSDPEEFIRFKDLSPSDVEHILSVYEKSIVLGMDNFAKYDAYFQTNRKLLETFNSDPKNIDGLYDKWSKQFNLEDKVAYMNMLNQKETISVAAYAAHLKIQIMIALELNFCKGNLSYRLSPQWEALKMKADNAFGHDSLLTNQVNQLHNLQNDLTKENKSNDEKLRTIRNNTPIISYRIERSDNDKYELKLKEKEEGFINYYYTHLVELQKAIMRFNDETKRSQKHYR